MSAKTASSTKVIEHNAASPKPPSLMLYIIIALLVISWGLLIVIGNYAYNMGLTLSKQMHSLSTEIDHTPRNASHDNNYAIDIENLNQRVDFLEDQLDLFSAPLMESLSDPAETQDNNMTPETEDGTANDALPSPLPTEEKPQKTTLQNSVSDAQMKALEKHLAHSNALLTKSVEKNTTSMLLIAVINLKDTMAEGLPYSKELAAVRALGKGNHKVENNLPLLQSIAGDGVPTLPTLQKEFEAMITPLLKTEIAGTDEQQGMTGWIKNTLSDVVQIRKIGSDIEGQSTEALVARAEAFLQEGKLIDAVKTLELLEEAPLKVARPWILQAKKRIAALTAIEALYKHVVVTTYDQ